MTTFTTEDRIMAEKDGSFTVNVEPIPFAGMVTLTEPKYKELTDEEILIEAKYQPNLGYYLACEYDVLDFARAILRKAQEK
jgi:hypothetical protein